MKNHIIFSVLMILILIFPSKAGAVLQNLNGLTSQNQSFLNDINVTISSLGTTHVLGWSGLLSSSRGGTGANLLEFPLDAIFFNDGGTFAGDARFSYDKTTTALTIGQSLKGLKTGWDIETIPADQDNRGGYITLTAGNGNGEAGGGEIVITAGSAGIGTNPQDGGNISLRGGFGTNGGSDGLVIFPDSIIQLGSSFLDASIAGGRTFTFPNSSGTFSFLELEQNVSGRNTFSNPVTNFISSTSSTVHIGMDGIPGCLVMGDSDGSGVTYITVNNGTLSASPIPSASCN